ncbi:pyruvate kinase [Deinobacterium chartae]|uniref:Pyruvate kinase n=1 Tax=Deinobacterium chartae TaxID=521158 RepID=A0A841I5Y0_9DEIO|nr:pyruvate kinase [Deinobacterium chartae]MBB6099840.1 pyruvate kinase [Deinobacterium chartae]
MTHAAGPSNPQVLLARLEALREAVCREAGELMTQWSGRLERDAFRPSAQNLAHYLALRRRDLRELQAELVPWGLSSLGRSEAHVMATLEAVIATLAAICGERRSWPDRETFELPGRWLQEHTRALFGEVERGVAILVTLPSEAASDGRITRELLEAGADLVRINCAHDDADAWARMLAHLRAAEREVGRAARVLMDLGGPKPRTADVHLEGKERVEVHDRLLLHGGQARKGARVRCTLPEILPQLRVGARVHIDDGKIGAVVEELRPDAAVLRITRARPGGERLRAGKGLNFPDTALELAALSERDLEDLDFVARHADLIGYSFVQRPEDLEALYSELERRQAPENLGVVLKIETERAFRNLPQLIVTAAGRGPAGVMIARGDLLAEVGSPRLGEIQEEMLWLCEAAHLPVIWATQVLEKLVKKGLPSRAEITDAAMSERAECVMLNKGPYVVEGVRLLDDLLRRMSAHQRKKSARLRRLSF